MTLRRTGSVVAGLAMMVALLAGCDHGPKGESMSPSSDGPTYDAAFTATQQYARQAVHDTPPSTAKLIKVTDFGFPNVGWCSDSSDPPPGTKVNMKFYYKIHGVPKADVRQYFHDFQTGLHSKDWTRDYGSFDTEAVAMSKGDYTLLLQYAPSNGLLSLGAQSPCVAPKDPHHPLGD